MTWLPLVRICCFPVLIPPTGASHTFSARVSWKVLEVQTTNQERAQDKLQRYWTAWSVFHHYAHRTKSAVCLAENLRITLGVFECGLFQEFEHKFDLQTNPSKSCYIPVPSLPRFGALHRLVCTVGSIRCLAFSRFKGVWDGGSNSRDWGVDVPQIGNSEMFSSQDLSLSGHPKRVGPAEVYEYICPWHKFVGLVIVRWIHDPFTSSTSQQRDIEAEHLQRSATSWWA